jgi:hypothetical protein
VVDRREPGRSVITSASKQLEWSEVQNKWNAHVAAVRQGVEEAKTNLDADWAERRAERAEDAAAASIADDAAASS